MKTIYAKIKVPDDAVIARIETHYNIPSKDRIRGGVAFTYEEIKFPLDKDVTKEINIRFTDEYTRQEVSKLIEKYRRQTIGELIGHNNG